LTINSLRIKIIDQKHQNFIKGELANLPKVRPKAIWSDLWCSNWIFLLVDLSKLSEIELRIIYLAAKPSRS